MDELATLSSSVLGLGAGEDHVTAAQMALRAAIVYIVTLIMVRLGKKRFMGQATAFDMILGIMLGSIVSRAITGNAPFFPALAAAGLLIAMHSMFTGMALRSYRFGNMIKGHPRLLVRDGKIEWP